MKAVLLNLIINAAQAMGHAGQIVVSIAETDQRCQISVADHGPGIPEEIRENIFDPFFTTKHRGTGLGLAVARRTVELHGGKLRFECPPGGGTVMIVSLPVTPRR
jgi:signal transduction histidine kinase